MESVEVSVWSMFTNSDLFMKTLMLGMMAASVWTWTIIISKVRLFRHVGERVKTFEERFWSGNSLETLYNSIQNKPNNPLAAIFLSAMKEWKRSFRGKKSASAAGVNMAERIEKGMQMTVEDEIQKMESHMVFLASVGSVSPLLGLFGTVWGIMDSFQAIGVTQNTNITAVAPGVAEALLTTAVGLIAAIPALVAYNKFSNDIDKMTHRMDSFSGELSAIISRQIEQMGEEA